MGFQLPRVTKCCFCANLRTGALIIGYVSCVFSIFGILLYSGLIVAVSGYVNRHSDKPPDGHTQKEITAVSVTLFVLFAMKIALMLFYFAMSILLVIGAHKERPQLMKYYFIAGMVNLVFSLVMIVTSFIFTGFLSTVIQLVECAIIFYLLLVVRSAYLHLEESQRPRPKAFEMSVVNRQQQPLMV